MSSKENSLQSSEGSRTVFVKPEPSDAVLPFGDANSRENITDESGVPSTVKQEPIESQSAAAVALAARPSSEAANAGSTLKQAGSDVKTLSSKAHEVAVPMYFSKFDSAASIIYTPEKSLKEGLNMVKTLNGHVQQLQLGSKMRKDVWLKEIASLESQGTPSTLIAVCGATGAGKSSILNAILDDNIVPTSGMRACTAVVTEIGYHKEKTIAADVAFLTEREWKDELAVLLDDLVDENGQVRRTGDLRSESGVAWHKVHAVYPRLTQDRLVGMTVDQLLAMDKKIAAMLGTVKKISAKDSKEFTKFIAKYIDSKDQKRGKDKDKKKKDDKAEGPALWPLIRQVNVRCPSEALSTGAILVDLPGVADANAARSSIARDYMKKADCIWILAPITRAVDDKTAKDLLGEAFKSQIMNGGINDVTSTLTFIATKCDDISCTEVVGALNLDDEPELEVIEERLGQIRSEAKEWKDKKTDAEKKAKGVEAELVDIRKVIAEHERHLQALEDGIEFVPAVPKAIAKKRKNKRGGKSGSPKRQKSVESNNSDSDVERMLGSDDDMEVDDFIVDDGDISDKDSDCDESSDSDSDASDSSRKRKKVEDSDEEDDELDEDDVAAVEDPLTIDDVKGKVAEKKAELKAARERLNEARKEKKTAADTLTSLEKKKVKAQREKNGFCSLKRSEFSRDVLKEDFRTGLKELDDAEAERRDPSTFDPSINLRDYASIDLPTFTVSARDYIRLTKQVKGDGDPTCFSNLDDTGVPELQQWCKKLTVASRERAARGFRRQLRVFATNIRSYLEGFGTVSEEDRASLREQWQTKRAGGLIRMDDGESNSGDTERDDSGDDDDDPYGLGNLRKTVNAAYSLPQEDDVEGVSMRLADELVVVVEDSVKEMQDAFKDGLEDKCQTGAEYAAENAAQLVDEFASSCHWATYRATLRRLGVFRRNINEELTTPMMKNIASSWAKVFEADLFASFEGSVLRCVRSLLRDFEESCASSLKGRAKNQSDMCVEEVKVALKKMVDVVREQLQTNQKDVSRCLAPLVQDQLTDGYTLAMQERGTGSVARQKAVFRNFIIREKDDLFTGGADTILEKLDNMAVDVGKALLASLEHLADKVEVNLAVLWEGPVDAKSNIMERSGAMEHVDAMLEQLQLWDSADGLRTTTESRAS